ncbi:MAG: C69 family dipeptidase [Alistipes sp.]|nr:C69 family dipeptidase [Alistipes sp.]
MKRLILTFVMVAAAWSADACTNFIVTKGASTDGSVMVSYAADSHQLYGALYFVPGGKFKAGDMLRVEEWDTGKYLGNIPQIPTTHTTIGNMNEHSLIIAETTYGGRPELEDPNGVMDYGSLIYIALQRAKTAREAIAVIADLAATHGYASSGESFSIADKDEAWIMELIQKQGGKVTRDNVVELLNVTPPQAYRLLKKLSNKGRIKLVGNGRSAYYELI